MIVDLILSGQRDNYLLLAELFKNINGKEIYQYFMDIVNELQKEYQNLFIKFGEDDFDSKLTTDYYEKYDKLNLQVFPSPMHGLVYIISINKYQQIRVSTNKVYFYTQLFNLNNEINEFNYDDPHIDYKVFKQKIINFLSKA